MVVEILFPKLCNLFGDRGNVVYLKQCLKDATFIETGLNEQPYFVTHEVDLIYMGPATESNQQRFVNRLRPYTKRLQQMIDQGTYFLLTGNAIEVFGTKVVDHQQEVLQGLNLVNLTSQRDFFGRKNSIYLGKYHDYEIVGFKSQFTVSESSEQPLFENEKGFGLNLTCPYEGICKNHLFATYLLGPFLILNPLFTKELLTNLGVKDVSLPHEELVLEAYRRRVEDIRQATQMSHG